MLRPALLLSGALAVLWGPGDALASRTTTVSGSVRAVAFSGDALAVARVPPRTGLTLERHATGSAPQPLLSTSLRSAEDQITLAGSAQAVATGIQPGGGGFGAGRVFVGPAEGPLREVSACPAGLLVPPVAVSAARIAWRDGACGDPAENPSATTPAAIVIAAADPAVSATRFAVDPDLLPISIVLAGDGGLIGLLRPSFFAINSEVRTLGARGVGPALLGERGRIVSPVGVLTDGTGVFSLAMLDGDASAATCPNSLFTIAPGSTQPRRLDVGGCLLGADLPAGPSAAKVGGDRVLALVTETAPGSRGSGPPLTSVVSVRGDGGDRRVHARGSYRPPLGIAAGGGRIAYWHQRCVTAASDIVAIDGAGLEARPQPIASCTAAVLTREARVREGQISVRLRCPAGCSGTAIDAGGEIPQRLRSFSFARGTHTVHLAPSQAARRSGRLRLRLALEAGPERSALIRLRRRGR